MISKIGEYIPYNSKEPKPTRKPYRRAYEVLDKLSLDEEKKAKIWTILHYVEILGEPIPEISELAKRCNNKLELMIKKYERKLRPSLVRY